IIGSTGSGKSTLIKLIARFYDVEDGAVLIDGINVKEMMQQELRNKIGYVPQQASLFSGTITDNLQYGKEDANEEEIIDALKTAQAIDFVMEKEEGIQANIEQ